MKTLQEFEEFLAADTELAASLGQVEAHRKRTKSSFFISLLIAVVFVVGAGWFMYSHTKESGSGTSTNNVIYMVLIFIGASFAITYLYVFLNSKKMSSNPAAMSRGSGDLNYDFKDRVIRKMVAFWDPSFRYQINNHIKSAEVVESGMLYPRSYKAGGSDMIQGEIDGVAFRFSDLQLLLEKTFVGKNDNPYETVISGSFFIAGFPKTFRHPVFVYSKSSAASLQHEGEKVLLEDPEFMEMFNVYGANQIEARYILTTSLMERIKALGKKMGTKLHIAFANNKLYVMNNNGSDRFEASWFKRVDKRETLIQFYNELAEQLSIIEDLKLNDKIWKTE